MGLCSVRSSPIKRFGFEPWPGTLDCVLFLGKTVPLSTQVYKWALVNLMLGVTLRWTSIPARGGEEILLVCCFMLLKPEISADLLGHLTCMQTLL